MEIRCELGLRWASEEARSWGGGEDVAEGDTKGAGRGRVVGERSDGVREGVVAVAGRWPGG